MTEEETVENIITLEETISSNNCLKNQVTIKQPKRRMRKLFNWLRNLSPIKRQKVLFFLAIGFRRYASQFINGLVDQESHSRRKNCLNILSIKNKSVYLALQIKRKSFLVTSQQKILPRFPPFSCSKCGFSSRKLRPVVRHICTRRAHEYKNVVHTATLGFRSRCRDALAIMERIPRPQTITIYLANNIYETNVKGEELIKIVNQLKQPETLRNITGRIVHNLLRFSNTCTIIKTTPLNRQKSLLLTTTAEELENEENGKYEDAEEEECIKKEKNINIEEENEKTSLDKEEVEEEKMGKDEEEREENNNKKKNKSEKEEEEKNNNPSQNISYSDGSAYFCRSCAHIFARHNDWSKHFSGNKCLQTENDKEEPLEIQVNIEETFPVSGSFIPAFVQISKKPSTFYSNDCWSMNSDAVCTKCFSTNFASRAEFHAHIFKCALEDREIYEIK